MTPRSPFSSFFFFNDTATTEIYTLSLHDALPISPITPQSTIIQSIYTTTTASIPTLTLKIVRDLWNNNNHKYKDRKSTRLNSSHLVISYAVFCLKKKKNNYNNRTA